MGSGTAAAQSQWTAAFVQRLRDLGWNEGRNVAIVYRWAEGRSERFAEIAAEFVRLKVDVILTHNTPPVLAAKRATSVIPIVFATAGDPVGSGIVGSLSRPEGNITGLSSQAPETAGKRLELLLELVPSLRRLAILSDVGNPFSARDADEVRKAARPSDSRSSRSQSGDPEISIPRSKRSGAARRHCTSQPFRSCSSIAFASMSWRLQRGYRRCTACGSMSKREV
jgi:hypothetical protein